MRYQTRHRLPEHGLISGELFEKSDLSAGCRDRDSIFRRHLALEKTLQHHFRAIHTVSRKMQIVEEEKDRAAVDARRRRDWLGGVGRIGSSRSAGLRRQFQFAWTAGSDAFKERDRTRLAVDQQLKLIFL